MLVECNGRKVECWMFSWECVAVCECAKWYVLFIFFLLFFFQFSRLCTAKAFSFYFYLFYELKFGLLKRFFCGREKKYVKVVLQNRVWEKEVPIEWELKGQENLTWNRLRNSEMQGGGKQGGTDQTLARYIRGKKQQCTGT